VFKAEVVPDDVWETFSMPNFLASNLHINKVRVALIVWTTKATFGWLMIPQQEMTIVNDLQCNTLLNSNDTSV